MHLMTENSPRRCSGPPLWSWGWSCSSGFPQTPAVVLHTRSSPAGAPPQTGAPASGPADPRTAPESTNAQSLPTSQRSPKRHASRQRPDSASAGGLPRSWRFSELDGLPRGWCRISARHRRPVPEGPRWRGDGAAGDRWWSASLKVASHHDLIRGGPLILCLITVQRLQKKQKQPSLTLRWTLEKLTFLNQHHPNLTQTP